MSRSESDAFICWQYLPDCPEHHVGREGRGRGGFEGKQPRGGLPFDLQPDTLSLSLSLLSLSLLFLSFLSVSPCRLKPKP